MLRKIFRFSLFIVLTVFVLAVVMVVYYQFDEELETDVKNVLDYTPPAVSLNDNGYYHLLGLFSAENTVPHVHGMKIAETAKQRAVAGDDVATLIFTEGEQINILKPVSLPNSTCEFDKGSCLQIIKNNRHKVSSMLQTNRLLISRFKETYRYPEFQETPYSFGFNHLILTHKMILTEIASEWLNGNRTNAIKQLENDFALLRKVSAAETSLITRMIIVAMMSHDLSLWSELIADCHNCKESDLLIRGLERPFTSEELSMRKVLGYEFRYMTNTLENVYKKERNKDIQSVLIDKLLYKPNSLKNKSFSVHREMIRVSECKINDFISCEKRYFDFGKNLPDYSSWAFIDDPVGSVIQAIAMPSYNKYARSQFRNEAKRRMLLISKHIHQNKMSAAQIKEFLQELPEEQRNPFAHKQIFYNEAENELVLEIDADDQIKIRMTSII